MKKYIKKMVEKVKSKDINILNLTKTLMGYGISFASTKIRIPISLAILLIDIINGQKENNKKKQDLAIEILKNHEKIPKISKIETSELQIEINLETSEITGLIIEGEFKGVNLKKLSKDDIQKILETSEDEDTISFLKKYKEYK